MPYITEQATVQGAVRIPGSKSHTIRALLLAAAAEGQSIIGNPLYSKDTEACIAACRLLGADIDCWDDSIRVRGIGGLFKAAENIIDVGNSGTTLYLTAPLASLADGATVFTGDEQIRSRPISPLLQSLNDLGAEAWSTKGNGSAPVVVKGRLKGGRTKIECPTSQYLSGLLLAAPLAEKDTIIDVPLLHERPYVDMTLNWLKKAGIHVENDSYKRFRVPGGQKYKAMDSSVAADFSSATFFMCAPALTGGSLTLQGLDMNDPQGDKAVLGMLERMGCVVTRAGGEITLNGAGLRGADLDLNSTPDALPAMAVTACFAKGKTRLGNVPQARLKETDRIAVTAKELAKLGAKITELEDGLEIEYSPLRGGTVSGHKDHRIVMALAIAGLAASGPIEIDDVSAASITFPTFFELLDSIKTKGAR